MQQTTEEPQFPISTGKIIKAHRLISGDMFSAPGGSQVNYCMSVDKQNDTIHMVCLCNLSEKGVFDKDEPVVVMEGLNRQVELYTFKEIEGE